MSKNLEQIAEQLKTPQVNKKGEANPVPKVQLIYAFNGTGKTRLSLELKNLISPKVQIIDDIADPEEVITVGNTRDKFLYYNAFTEDLFYWDNDLEADNEPKLKIQPNSFTDLIFKELKDQGLDSQMIGYFQKLIGSKINPIFNIDEGHVTFTIPGAFSSAFSSAFSTPSENIKISKGEESNFIWSIFYTLLEQVILTLNVVEENLRDTDQFNDLEYVFIDDPVSSLDDNHLIELAVSLATTIKNSRYENNQGLRFVVTTHNPLFYNVLHNELNNDLEGIKSDGSKGKVYKKKQSAKYVLKKHADGTFQLEGSNDRPFSYHLFLLDELRKLDNPQNIEKYHFNFLRNILEKTATFLGYKQWNELLKKLPEDDRDVMNRMLNLYSHSAHAGEEVAALTDEDKNKFIKLIKEFAQKYNFAELKEDENAATN